MKFGPREILFMLPLVAIPLGAWWFVFQPRNTQIADARVAIEAKRAKLSALSRASSDLDNLKDEIDEHNKAIAFFRSKLPTKKQMDLVIRDVSKLARENNLKVKEFSRMQRTGVVRISDPDGPYAEEPILITLEGDFNRSLYSFLLALEKKARITRIHQLEVEKKKNSDEGRVEAKLVMSIFYERDEKDQG